MRRRLVGLVVLGAALACSKPSEEVEAKQWPKHEPPRGEVAIPAQLSIALVVDGQPRPAITAETLKAAKPDWSDAERKAWRIASLVPEAAPAGAVEAKSPTGFSITFQHPTPDGREPALYLTRRGEVIVAALDPKDPFPRFHGQGGRLARSGDSMPHVAPVATLEVKKATP